MVDFPEYYEQMLPSLAPPAAAPAAAAPAPAAAAAAPATPATTSSRPAPSRPATVTPETIEDLEQFQREYRERLAAGPAQPQQLSVLDMLRKRMAREMEGEDLRRIGELGAGMLASESPNFFTMLGAGVRAAREGDVSRMDRLRQLAETERQQQELELRQTAQQAEERDRQARLRLDERRIAQGDRPQYQVVGQDARGNAIVVDMRDPTRRQVLEGVTPMQVANFNARTDAAREAAAIRAGTAAVAAAQRDALGRQIESATLDRIFREAYERALNPTQTGSTAQAGTGSSPVTRETFIPPEQRR